MTARRYAGFPGEGRTLVILPLLIGWVIAAVIVTAVWGGHGAGSRRPPARGFEVLPPGVPRSRRTPPPAQPPGILPGRGAANSGFPAVAGRAETAGRPGEEPP